MEHEILRESGIPDVTPRAGKPAAPAISVGSTARLRQPEAVDVPPRKPLFDVAMHTADRRVAHAIRAPPVSVRVGRVDAGECGIQMSPARPAVLFQPLKKGGSEGRSVQSQASATQPGAKLSNFWTSRVPGATLHELTPPPWDRK